MHNGKFQEDIDNTNKTILNKELEVREHNNFILDVKEIKNLCNPITFLSNQYREALFCLLNFLDKDYREVIQKWNLLDDLKGHVDLFNKFPTEDMLDEYILRKLQQATELGVVLPQIQIENNNILIDLYLNKDEDFFK